MKLLKLVMNRNIILPHLTNKLLLNTLRQKIPSSMKLQQRDAILSEKEIAMLRFMCEEKSTNEIAETVELSPRTN